MTPRATNSDKAKTEQRISPFDQITQLEQEQEQRVIDALRVFEEEERETAKSLAHAEKNQEELMRAEATEQIKAYAATEPATLLKLSDEKIKSDIKDIDGTYTKKNEAIIQELVSHILDQSFFNRS